MRSGAKTKADTNMAYLWIINNLLGLFQLEMKAEFKEAAVHLWEQFWLLTPTHMRTRRIKIHQQLRPLPFPSHHTLHAQVIFFPSVYSLYSWPCVWPLSGCRMFVDLSVCECIQLHPQWGDLDLYSFVEYPRVMSLAPFTVILNHNIFFVSQLYVMRILEKVEQSPGGFKLYWRHRTEAVIKVFYVFNRKRTLVHNNGDWFTFVWWQINNIP